MNCRHRNNTISVAQKRATLFATPRSLCALTLQGFTLFADGAKCLHHNQRGTISILSVFAMMMFTFLLVMIMNVSLHVDDKVKMQNAADASAYSGTVTVARGMNALSFSNHLLCDVFAMTAYLREGRDRNVEPLTGPILDAWEEAGGLLTKAETQKLNNLGIAIQNHAGGTQPGGPERRAVQEFGDLTEASSELTLPVFEMILSEELIPKFQRTLIRQVPGLAQQATFEVAYRHGELQRNHYGSETQLSTGSINADRLTARSRGDGTIQRGPQFAVLWRTAMEPVDADSQEDPFMRTIPAVDVSATGSDINYLTAEQYDSYFNTAESQRKRMSMHYLDLWNRDRLMLFRRDAELPHFYWLWRIASLTQLRQLLEIEYPDTNMPVVLRSQSDTEIVDLLTSDESLTEPGDPNLYLERNFDFVSVVYRDTMHAMGSGIFHNPLSSVFGETFGNTTDPRNNRPTMTFAQCRVFVPRGRRYRRYFRCGGRPTEYGIGGTYGFDAPSLPKNLPEEEANEDPDSVDNEIWCYEGWPGNWDLFNQNWTVQLVPATTSTLPQILQTPPSENFDRQFELPSLGDTTRRELSRINTH